MKTPKFKQTDIGPIPVDWDIKELASIATNFNYGVSAEAVPYVSGPKYIRITDINEMSHRYEPIEAVAPAFMTAKSVVEDGDILVARTGASVGKSYHYDVKDGDLVFAGFLMRFRPIEINSKFVFYHTLSRRYWQWVASESARSGQPGINIQQLKRYCIPVPSASEQRAIAEVLSDADEMLATLDKLIEKKRAIKTGAMQQLLSGKKRLPGFSKSEKKFKKTEIGPVPADWEVRQLGDCGIFSKGRGISRSQVGTGNLPCVRYGEIYTDYNDFIREFKSYISEDIAAFSTQLKDGDILFASSGETKEEIGKAVAYLGGQERVFCGGDIIVFSPHSAYDPKFLGYLLNTKIINDQKSSRGQGDAVVHIRGNDLAGVYIPCPLLSEQRAIAEVLSSMDGEIEALLREREKYARIKQGMMREILTGTTRLEVRQ